MPSLFLDDVDTIMLPVDVVQLQSAYINSSEPRIKCQYRKGFVPERNIFRYIKMFYDCIVFLVRIDFEDVPLFGKQMTVMKARTSPFRISEISVYFLLSRNSIK